ncbi:MAG: protein-glutamate O-methyltransferase CheR [bacterium]|nr:protein-glutamate O-methyltransferase CheR [bacterium]
MNHWKRANVDAKTFEGFRELVYRRSGIALGDQKQALVTARVGKRMKALGIANHRAYLDYVESDSSEQELVHLIDAISTNVTSFFREPDHFDFLREAVQEWASDGQSRFRFWSAASSTGEEPYSIAMTLSDSIDTHRLDVRLLATDISTRVLERCVVGVYDRDRVDTVPTRLRDRFFTKLRDGGRTTQYAVADGLKEMVRFRRLNLSTMPFPMKGPLDMVFCRNVMIYFDNDLRARLMDEIHRLLKPGGYLLVGHAESLTGILTPFKTVRPSVYVK